MSPNKAKATRRAKATPKAHAAPTVTVDGIEGQLARIELPDGTTVDWPLSILPEGVQEGDVIRLSVVAGAEPEVDHHETQSRRQKAQDALTELNADAPKGDLEL